MKYAITARWVLLIGLAFVFATFGMWKFTQPTIWIGWIPPSLEGMMGMSKHAWLRIFGSIEILLAVALLIPARKLQQAAAALIVLHLIAIISQVGWNDVGVRDIGLLFAAVAALLLLKRRANL